jgi:hypothetical protein
MDFFNQECKTIYESIHFYNLGERGGNRIPDSDVFIRDLANILAIGEKKVLDYIHALRDSHFIFILNIAQEDKSRKINALDGFIVADKEVIPMLLLEYEIELHKIYQAEKQQDRSTDAILKEYLPQMNVIKTTHIGKLINIVSMLREFDHYLVSHPEEFSDTYRNTSLESNLKEKKLLLEEKIHFEKNIEDGAPEDNAPRENWFQASAQQESEEETTLYDETNILQEYSHEKLNLAFEKALKIYGLKFIVRLYFRKNKFSFVDELIRQNKFFDLKDLKLIRETLKTIMKTIYSETKVNLYRSDILRLDRTLNQAIRKYSS